MSAREKSQWRSLGGSSRRYENVVTGEIISRRAYMTRFEQAPEVKRAPVEREERDTRGRFLSLAQRERRAIQEEAPPESERSAAQRTRAEAAERRAEEAENKLVETLKRAQLAEWDAAFINGPGLSLPQRRARRDAVAKAKKANTDSFAYRWREAAGTDYEAMQALMREFPDSPANHLWSAFFGSPKVV